MKKFYKNPWQWYHGLQKIGITALTLIGASQILDAQVSSYSFSQNTGTFSSIAPTGTLVTGSDATTATTNDTSGWSVSLPFTFNFNGIGYTSIYVNSNGGATFGATTSTSSTVISTSTAYSGAVGVMNRDLWGVFVTSGVTTSGSNIITNVTSMKGIEVGKALNNVNGIPTGATVTAFDETAGTITMSAPATSSSTSAVVRYGSGKIFTSTVGTAPNRVFVIEWIGYNDYGTTVGLSNHLNFQLRLSESNNSISTVYGPHYSLNATAVTNQVGLRGATASDYNNRSSATSWSATTAGTSNTSSVSRSSTIFPAVGQTFTWSPPTCLAPSGVTAGTVTTNTASISWTASSTVPSNGYEYYYSTSATAPTSTTTPSGVSSGTTATLSSLTPATTYYVWVRSVCSTTDISGWSASGTFVTNCLPVATMNENFDSFATGSIVPTCWGRIVTGSASQTITSTTPASGTRNIYQYNATTGGVSVVVLPEFNTINTGYQLRFKVRATAAATLDVGYLTNATDASTFVVVQSLNVTNTTYGAETKVPFPTTVPSTARVAVRMPVQTSAPSIYWDDAIWEVAPTCIEPSGVTISNVTTSSANVSYTAPVAVPANGYEYYYSTSNTAPTATTVASGTSVTTNAPLSGLTSATTYYVWVRSVCSASDKSPWTSVATFTTACNPITSFPWNENFDTMTTIGNGVLPSCWTTTGGFSSSYLFTTQNAASQTYNDPRSAPNYVTIYYPTTAAYLWAPAMTLTAGQSYDFSFYWAGDATSGWVGDVLVNNSPSATGATNLNTFVTQTTTTTNAYTKVTVTFVPATTGSYNFGIKSFSATTAPYYMGFDDFNVQLTPACAEPTSVAVNSITSSSATLSWNAPATAPANGYVYAYSTTNTTPTSGTATTATSIPLSQLTPSTTYYYWVRSVCSATSNSAWVAGSFTTSATPPANDDCVGAVMLTVNPDYACGVTTSGTTVSATASTETAPTCGATGTNDDVWFKFIATNTAHRIVLSNVSGSTDMAMAAYSGSCGSLVQVLCSDPNTMDLTGLIVGQEYKVRVWTYTSTATTTATFNICVGTPPPPPANDNCSGAILLTPGATFAQNPLTATTVGATLTTDATATTACQTTRYADTWYSVVVPASGSITIETATTAGTAVTDTVMGVYTGSCGSLVSVGCNDDILAGTNNFSKVSLTGQTPGQTLLIGVWNYSSSNNGAFQISAYDASLSTSETAQVKNDVTVYPNPFADILNISDVKNVKSVSVIDIAGRLIKTIEKPSSALQLGELKSGMYIVVLNMNDGSKQTIKAIKK